LVETLRKIKYNKSLRRKLWIKIGKEVQRL